MVAAASAACARCTRTARLDELSLSVLARAGADARDEGILGRRVAVDNTTLRVVEVFFAPSAFVNVDNLSAWVLLSFSSGLLAPDKFP